MEYGEIGEGPFNGPTLPHYSLSRISLSPASVCARRRPASLSAPAAAASSSPSPATLSQSALAASLSQSAPAYARACRLTPPEAAPPPPARRPFLLHHLGTTYPPRQGGTPLPSVEARLGEHGTAPC